MSTTKRRLLLLLSAGLVAALTTGMFLPHRRAAFRVTAVTEVTAVATASSSSGAGVNTLSFDVTVPANGNAIFVGILHINASGNVASVTFNGDALTELWDVNDGAAEASAGFYMVAPDVGTYTLTVTLTNSSSVFAAGAVVMANVNQVTPVRTAATAVVTGTALTVTAPDAATNDLIVDCAAIYAATLTIGADQTERYVVSRLHGSQRSIGVTTQPGSAGGVMSWTMETVGVTGAVAFRP